MNKTDHKELDIRPASLPEMSVRAGVAGVIIGVLFGAANAYLGLKAGLTVSASIPAAVMSVALFRALFRMRLLRNPVSLLEHNMVQTIGSAGESLAAGVIFTVPALILLGYSPAALKIFVLAAIGGVLGVMFMVPLRAYLVEREHGRLIYPEGTACASVLLAAEKGGTGGGLVFAGLGFGALYEFLGSALKLWKSSAVWQSRRVAGLELSADSSAALLAAGYVIGPRISAIMFAGGALSWLFFIPAIKFFLGRQEALVLYPAPVPVSELGPHQIWHYYMRYIGAGAVVYGGLASLVKSAPLILESLREAMKNLGREKGASSQSERTRKDLPLPFLAALVLVCFLAMCFLPRSMAPGKFLPSLLALVFSFFFIAVSARIVGLVGSSSNPVSGMTIAALLGTSLVFKFLGLTDAQGRSAALVVGAVVCISAAIAGDTSQDLKTGFLVGATPWRQQLGELLGVLSSAAVIGFVVLRLHRGYGIGSESLPAPQATLMSMVVEGVLSGNLPWMLVLAGMALAAIAETSGLPSLPFAVGLYLPLSLTVPILLGGLLRGGASGGLLKKAQARNSRGAGVSVSGSPEHEEPLEKQAGVLFASGMIAGSAFLGMAIGLVRSLGAESPAGKFLDRIALHPWSSDFAADLATVFALFGCGVILFMVSLKREKALRGG